MTVGADEPDTMWGDDDRQLATVARNVATRYLAIILDALIGLVLLPFNVAPPRARRPTASGC